MRYCLLCLKLICKKYDFVFHLSDCIANTKKDVKPEDLIVVERCTLNQGDENEVDIKTVEPDHRCSFMVRHVEDCIDEKNYRIHHGTVISSANMPSKIDKKDHWNSLAKKYSTTNMLGVVDPVVYSSFEHFTKSNVPCFCLAFPLTQQDPPELDEQYNFFTRLISKSVEMFKSK